MKIKLTFLGAAQNVTGSRYLIEVDNVKVLVDCGLYQERQFLERNWDPFPVDAKTINAVLLTHAHLDHCGLLPKLVREGFQGKIYCNAATAEISQIVLLDSAQLQEEDAEYKRKRHKREQRKGPRPVIPLYTADDAKKTFPLFSSVGYEEPIVLADGIEATFFDAGHILGSSMIKLKIHRNGQERAIVFSGDVGRWNKPILRDPSFIDHGDYVLIESTYGDRVHEDKHDIDEKLSDIINSTQNSGGNIIIPSFALERAQEILYRLNTLLLEDRIPNLMTFVDSPMAINVTEVFKRHPELYDKQMTELMNQKESPFNFSGLTMSRSTRQSKAINQITGTIIVIAGSGMCTGGRVKHHLVNNITRPESTILFVGYQAAGTLGRLIANGKKEVRILGRNYPVKARVERIYGFSGHADRNELLEWLSGMQKAPKRVFVTHGEAESAHSFADLIGKEKGWEVSVPKYKDQVILD